MTGRQGLGWGFRSIAGARGWPSLPGLSPAGRYPYDASFWRPRLLSGSGASLVKCRFAWLGRPGLSQVMRSVRSGFVHRSVHTAAVGPPAARDSAVSGVAFRLDDSVGAGSHFASQ